MSQSGWHRARQAKASTAARGYGANHAAARKTFAAKHRESDPCTRCGQALGPMGPWLHLDHTDDRRGYRGFAHGSCNRLAGAREGSRRAHGRRRARMRPKPVPRRNLLG